MLEWCKGLESFVLLCSTPHYEGDYRLDKNGSLRVNSKHAFYLETPWGLMTLEALNQGICAHAMGRFYADKAIEVFEPGKNSYFTA